MRRSTPLVAAVAVLLALAGTALAAPPAPSFAQGGPGHGFVPAHEAVLDASIDGRVLKYDGSPEVGGWVTWARRDEQDVSHGDGLTDDEGRFSFTGIPATEDNGYLSVLCTGGWDFYSLDGLSWEAPGPTSFEIRPGAADLDVAFGSQAEDLNRLRTEISTTDGAVLARARNEIPRIAEPSWAGPAYALPGTITSAVLYFGIDRGTELPALVGQTVTAGETLPGTYAVEQWAAQRVWLGGWASGRPGSKARLWIENYPKGWVNTVAGTSDSWVFEDLGKWVSVGKQPNSRLLTIPARTKPGSYLISVSHRDGPLTLRPLARYQVCTLNASKATIRRGSRVRLSGVVPTWKYTGSSKDVIVYKRTTAAGQPARKGGFTRWNGWTRVGTYKANDLGKFSTRLLRPSRTTWYVVWYPKDVDHRAAYTSVRKVTVK